MSFDYRAKEAVPTHIVAILIIVQKNRKSHVVFCLRNIHKAEAERYYNKFSSELFFHLKISNFKEA